MKLTRFRIYNYKSIVDSGYCDLASDITIFIGKNESGKTAILEALRDFDKEVPQFPQNAFPLDGSDELPTIELCFQLDQTEIDKIQADSGISIPKEFSDHILSKGLRIIKDSLGQYHLNDEFLSQLFEEKNGNKKEDQQSHIQSAKERLHSLLEGQRLPDISIDLSPEEIQKKTRELMVIVKSFLPSLKDEKKQNEIIESVRLIIRETKNLTQKNAFPKEKFLHCITGLMPRLIYFSEFIGYFPFAVPIAKLKETEPMLDFARISGLDLERVINAQDIQKRINILNRHSAVVNGEFGDYWKQNQIELVIKPEGDNILFFVKDRDKTDIFKIDQRSKGFQWFLSFYLRLSTPKSNNNIILIDEPGMNLHAKAQKEILKVLEEKIVPKTPVILSTHSSYLIDPLRLDRIRIVLKDFQRGSVISNHIPKDVDADTLIPINTALRMDTAGMLPLPGRCNVIVNDPADYYFLNTLKRYVKIPDQKEINLLPCSGDEGNLEQLVSLLKGFDFDFRVVLSRRCDGHRRGNQLKKKFGLEEERIVTIAPEPGVATEDLLAPSDFYDYVVQREANDDKTVSNSQYFEIHNIDCVLAARSFQDNAKAKDITLSDETVNTFQKIFDRIIFGEKPAVPTNQLPQEETEEKPELPEPQTVQPPKRRHWFLLRDRKTYKNF